MRQILAAITGFFTALSNFFKAIRDCFVGIFKFVTSPLGIVTILAIVGFIVYAMHHKS
ncbi:MAG TPA: hypothetical protein VFT64_08365 [Rickettsiales bacterium]|nr:hypothetical protein [Rickettsiales bacterium]